MDRDSIPNDAWVLCARLSDYWGSIHSVESHDNDGFDLGHVALSIYSPKMESGHHNAEQFRIQYFVCDVVYCDSVCADKSSVANHDNEPSCPDITNVYSSDHSTFPNPCDICTCSNERLVELLQ